MDFGLLCHPTMPAPSTFSESSPPHLPAISESSSRKSKVRWHPRQIAPTVAPAVRGHLPRGPDETHGSSGFELVIGRWPPGYLKGVCPIHNRFAAVYSQVGDFRKKLVRTWPMKANVLVEKLGKKKYRATTSQPIPLETEGTSQDDALERLYELAKKRLASGQLIQMNLPDGPATNPWQAYAGIWKDHPEFDAFLENIAEYRRGVNRPGSST
jgi:hypothetical protein